MVEGKFTPLTDESRIASLGSGLFSKYTWHFWSPHVNYRLLFFSVVSLTPLWGPQTSHPVLGTSLHFHRVYSHISLISLINHRVMMILHLMYEDTGQILYGVPSTLHLSPTAVKIGVNALLSHHISSCDKPAQQTLLHFTPAFLVTFISVFAKHHHFCL